MYIAEKTRYNKIKYVKCGNTGLKLPEISLGMWHNFGGVDKHSNSRKMVLAAFDHGITHFDLANNYGPPFGSAEETMGRLFQTDLASYRDELIISSKAGYNMWDGPYGSGGSRKYLISSLDQSLKRMGLEYVDIFYHHCPDPNTPLEETMGALDSIVKSGKALYIGVSNYPAELTLQACDILKSLGTPLTIHQPKYSMLERWVEDGLLDVLKEKGIGCIPFSPLAQGILTDKYLGGIPDDSRAGKKHGFLKPEQVTNSIMDKVKSLNEFAMERGQKLSQLALQWTARKNEITSLLIGSSNVSHINEAIEMCSQPKLTNDELAEIEKVLK